ncbi:MAG: hypothetical protein KatS3mg077_3107 [Candidatus Binatia bacterium]|nr:MAG: hypothetical protein KatS3mg077_3107 [Candidatus Binatia bacterium]
MNLEGPALTLVLQSRVAHLATADLRGRPHVVPICYAYDAGHFYFVIDRKPKSKFRELKRLRNIRENPHVAMVIDRYDDDWNRLAFVLVRGLAEVIHDEGQWAAAVTLLRQRYPGYRSMLLNFHENPTIRITCQKYHFWCASPPAVG